VLYKNIGNISAVGTPVERATDMICWCIFPTDITRIHSARIVKAARDAADTPAPNLDVGSRYEMRDWKTVRATTGIDIYFCDPNSPWQRGPNENANDSLRQ
jgi:IS30 family transposase